MAYRPRYKPLRTSAPAVYMRGGSSKAVFFHEKDIPPPGADRDTFLKRVMGTPDPLQIDGMGGTKAVTSKVAIIGPSTHPGADINYTFAQVGINDDAVGYTGNCGNISSAVGPFAIEEGLILDVRKGPSVRPELRTQTVRIYNTNTNKILTAHVPVNDVGAPIELGDFEIAAVPGTGAPIMMDYVDTVGARLQNGVLPSGNAVDTVWIKEKQVRLTICDVANPVIFFRAEDLGMTGYESAQELTDNRDLQRLVDELRGKGAQLVGLCDDWTKVDEQSPFLPLPVAVTKPKNKNGHVEARLFLDHMCHESMAGSGAVCTAACSRVPHTLVHDLLSDVALSEEVLRISHPVGIMPVHVKSKQKVGTVADGLGIPDFETLSFVRTARRIMEGNLLVPQE